MGVPMSATVSHGPRLPWWIVPSAPLVDDYNSTRSLRMRRFLSYRHCLCPSRPTGEFAVSFTPLPLCAVGAPPSSTCLCCCSRATHPRVSAAHGRVSSPRTYSSYARLLPPSGLRVGASPPTVIATHERASSDRLRRRLARLFPPSVFLVRASPPHVCAAGWRVSSRRLCCGWAPLLQPFAPPLGASLPPVCVSGRCVSSARLYCDGRLFSNCVCLHGRGRCR